MKIKFFTLVSVTFNLTTIKRIKTEGITFKTSIRKRMKWWEFSVNLKEGRNMFFDKKFKLRS